MCYIWRIVLCYFYIFMNNVISNKNCVPTFFYVPDFPLKVYRLEQYNVTIQVKLYENDFKNCGLKVKWFVGERFQKNRPYIYSGLLKLKTSVTNVTLDASSIPIERIFKSEWWIFSVNLTIPYEETLEIRKPFQWTTNYLKVVGGQKRTVFISDGDLILDVYSSNTDRTFTHHEKNNLRQYYKWVCLPSLIFVKKDVLKSSWAVEQNKLSPARYHCYVNVTLFINKTVDIVHIGNQYAYQFISVENKPLTDFYLHCIENCDIPKAEDDILLEIKCSYCQEENIVWEITESQNILGKIIRRSKRIQIEGRTFKPGSNITLAVSDGQKRFSRLVTFQSAITPVLAITCTKNCGDKADVSAETVFEVNCQQLCASIEWGRPNATGHKPYWYKRSSVSDGQNGKQQITFLPYTFKEGEKPVITAFAGDAFAAYGDTTFKVRQEISFTLNTNNNNDPRKETVINVICSYCVPEQDNKKNERLFFWTIDPKATLIEKYWSLINNNTTLTIKPDGIHIPIAEYSKENPSYEVKFTVTHEGKSEWTIVKFEFKVPELSWTCEPKMKSKLESNTPLKDTPTAVLEVENQCAHRLATCTIICTKNCDGLIGFEWFISSQFLNLQQYKLSSVFLKKDTLLFKRYLFHPGDLTILSVQLQGAMSPLRKLRIKWTHGVGNTYEFPKMCEKKLNPWLPHQFTAKCNGQNCDTCVDPITIDYQTDDYNVTKNAVKNLLQIFEDKKTILIPAYAFRPSEKVTIYVGAESQKPKKQTCTFGFEKKPEFTITCISNCEKPCDLQLPLELHVTCSPDASSNLSLNCQDLDYSWWLKTSNKIYPLTKISQAKKNDDLLIPPDVIRSGDQNTIDIDMRSFGAKNPYKFTCSYLIPKLKVTCFPLSCEGKPAKWPITMQLEIIAECIENCLHIKSFSFESSNTTKTQKNETGINSLKLSAMLFNLDEQLVITVSTGERLKSKIKKTFKFFENVPEFKIKCMYNCDSNCMSDPRLPVKLVADCSKNCMGVIYYWEVLEKPNHPDYLKLQEFLILSDDNSSCIIKANTFKHRQNVKSNYVQVRLLSPKKSTKAVTRRIYFQEPKSEIVIECLENCNQSNPFKNVKLQVKCMRFCQVQEYTWELVKYPVGFEWNKHILFEGNKRNFTILENTFKNKDKVKVVCYIGASKRKTTYDISFKIPDPELQLKCIGMNCGEIMNPHLEIEFEYKCLKNCNEGCKFKWKLEDSGGKDLTLNKYATVNAITNELTLKPYKFPNNTYLYVVLVGCGVTTKQHIQLSYPKPKINLKCEKNCDHDPKRETVYIVDCIENCDGLVYLWDLTPPPKNKKWKSVINLKEKSLTIPPDMYEYDDKVIITAKVFEQTKAKTIDFHEPYWEGKCDVIPSNGVAALTGFSVECKNFVKTATYYIFQEVEKHSADRLEDPVTRRSSLFITGNSETDEIFTTHVQTSKLGVLLKYTNNIPVTPLYLASCQKSIIVAIGQNWVIHVILRLRVNASAINNREYINSSSNIDRIRRSYDDEGNNVSIHETINNRLFQGIQLLINEKRFHKAFQILAALDTDLCLKETGKRIRHYRKHFLRVLQHQLIEHLHPLQGISFYWKILQCKCEQNDAFIGDLISENLLAANLKLDNLLQINRTYLSQYVLEYYIDDCLVALELILSCSFKRFNSLFMRDIISPDYLINERLIADEERELYHLHFMSNRIVKVVESTLSLGLTAQNTSDYVLNSSLVKFIALKSDQIPELLKFPNENRCYVSFQTFLEGQLKSKGSMFLFAFGIYNKNIFWWDGRQFGNVSGLPIIHLLIQKNNQTVHELTTPLQIHFVVNEQFNGVTKQKAIESLKVFRMRLKPNSLVIITIENSNMTSNMTASVSDVLPSQVNMQQYFTNITTSLQHLASRDTLFLLLYSTKRVVVNITLKVLSCLSWDRSSWAWERNTCSPNYVENELICKCNHLSLFTATQDSVELEHIEYQDALTEWFYSDYHFYVIGVSVVILILFVLLFVSSYLWDSSYLKQDSPLFLSDNLPGDEHLYIIVVTTGLHLNAGTTAVVGIQLQGKYGNSRRHLLNPPGSCRKILQRNRVDCFLMYVPNDLGVIKRLRLWHNSAGESPLWCCERIVVQYYRRPKTAFVFEPQKWLSLIALGSEVCHCSIPLKVKNCQPVRNMTWIGRLRQSWLDQTIDVCFLFYRIGSNYKCHERIAAATATAFAAMITAFFLVRRKDHLEFSHILYTSIVGSLVSLTLFTLFIKSLPRILH